MPRKTVAKSTAESANDAGPIFPEHPIFGRLPVVQISVSSVKYAGKVAIPTYLARVEPERITDGLSLRDLFGQGGRYKLVPLGPNGKPCNPPTLMDIPNEDGSPLDLVAPMPEGAGGGGGGSAVAPTAEIVGMYRDMASLADKARAHDFATFMELHKMQSSQSGEGPMVAFLQGELNASRSKIAALEARVEELRAQSVTLNEKLLRQKLGGEDDLFTRISNFALEKFGGMMPAMPASDAAPTHTAAVEDIIAMPSPDTLRELVKGGRLPKSIVVEAIKLHEAGALAPDLWAILEPLVSMARQAGAL